MIKILNPSTYIGITSNEQSGESYFVNGQFNITDGAFMGWFKLS